MSIDRFSAFITLLVAAVMCPSPSSGIDWTVSLRRAGPVQVGMTLAQVRRALGDPGARLEGNAPEVGLDKCSYLESKRVPESLGFMFSGGRVVRIDVLKIGIKTAAGAQVGDTEERIKRLYAGRIQIQAHHYDPQGHYLVYSSRDKAERDYGMVFETDGAKITSIRTGTLAAIALVEGCS